MNTYLCIGVSALCVIGASVYCEAVVRRVRKQAEDELREMRAQLEEMVRKAVREERKSWAREVLRREAVANALERKADEILSVMPTGPPELSRRVVEQFQRDAAALRPLQSDLQEAQRVVGRREEVVAWSG